MATETDASAGVSGKGAKRATKASRRDDREHTIDRRPGRDRRDIDAGEPWLDPDESADPRNRDPVTGRLLPGHKIAGPGRPKGSLDFMSVCRTKAREAGVKLSDLVWLATKGLASRAARGDAAAAKVLIDRLCGPIDKALINLELGAGAIPQAPPVTADGTGAPTLAEHLERLVTIARERGTQLGALADLKPADVVVKIAEDKAAAAVEELLS